MKSQAYEEGSREKKDVQNRPTVDMDTQTLTSAINRCKKVNDKLENFIGIYLYLKNKIKILELKQN